MSIQTLQYESTKGGINTITVDTNRVIGGYYQPAQDMLVLFLRGSDDIQLEDVPLDEHAKVLERLVGGE
ncbi:MAG: hypothetical protein ABEN55_04015 [Bradymonadaceae bacterium]